MANEVTKVELYGQNNDGDPRRFTVASGTEIKKGTNLKLNDNRTATISAGTGDPYAGTACMDKADDDYSISISAWENGVFDMFASGAVIVGQKVKTAAPGNMVMAASDADVTSSYQIIVGVAQKSGTNARIQVRVDN